MYASHRAPRHIALDSSVAIEAVRPHLLGGPVWLHPEDQEVILLRAEDRVLVLSVHRLRQEAHGGEGRERRSGEGKGLKAVAQHRTHGAQPN